MANEKNLKHWKPGQSGNPAGRPKTRPFKNALNEEIKTSGDDTNLLSEIAKQLISKAKGGDIPAMKELFDRLDGKPATTISLDLEKQISEMKPEEAINTITDSAANGTISLQEGQQLCSLVEVRMKALELSELEERLSKLETQK